MGNLELDPYTIYLLWEMKSILMQKIKNHCSVFQHGVCHRGISGSDS